MWRTKQANHLGRASPLLLQSLQHIRAKPGVVQSRISSFRDFTQPRHLTSDGVIAAPEQLSQRLKVISLVASCIQINSDVARFEVFAGRSAMIGFAVAFCAELVLPYQGLFGTWKSESYSIYVATTLCLVAGAAILAAMSKRSVGLQFRESVLTSLTALSRSASSITQRNVDSAVDYVFEQVFGTSFVDDNLIDLDEFI